MAAVLGCGHANQLFDVDYMDASPQVHLHFLTDEEEYDSLGYGRMELCCHGCGASTLVYYDRGRTRRQHLAMRDRFAKKHEKCPNMKFEDHCPNYRSSFETADVRRKGRSPASSRLRQPAEKRLP